MKTAVIIVAAGKGERAGGRADKVLQPLGGSTVLQRTILPFLAEARVVEIILVTPAGREKEFLNGAFPSGLPQRIRTGAIAGGERRQDSVAAGIAALTTDAELVAVHDAARPLHRGDVLARLIDRATKDGAAVPAVPIVDTIVSAGPGGRLVAAVDRERLRAVQTPQVFRRDWLTAAHETAAREQWQVTDDASVVLRAGHPVALVEGHPGNIKLTTEADFRIAEALLDEGKW